MTATGGRLEPPSQRHWLGTDELGRDMLNLTVHGARVSMALGFMATAVTVLLGVVIGVVCGFLGGWSDSVLMRITDFFLVLPTFVLALILTPIIRDLVGSSTTEILGIRMTLIVIVFVIGITSWSSTARIIRSQTLSLKERAFVDRARVIGAGSRHIMWRHILPNTVNLIVANAVLDVRRRRPDRDDARRSSGSAIRSSRHGARSSNRPRRPARRAWARGGTSFRPASGSSSSSSRSPSSGARSTTS